MEKERKMVFIGPQSAGAGGSEQESDGIENLGQLCEEDRVLIPENGRVSCFLQYTSFNTIFSEFLEKYWDNQSICFIVPKFPVYHMKDIAPLVKILGGVIVIFVILKILDGFSHFTSLIMKLIASIPYINDIIILVVACIAMILIEKRL